MSTIFQTDLGSVISLNTGVNISGALSVSIAVKKPSGLTTSWAATIGVDNMSVEHEIVAGDIDATGEAGLYVFQAVVTMTAGKPLHGESVSQLVKKSFE